MLASFHADLAEMGTARNGALLWLACPPAGHLAAGPPLAARAGRVHPGRSERVLLDAAGPLARLAADRMNGERRGGACLGLLVASAVSGLLWAALVLALVAWC